MNIFQFNLSNYVLEILYTSSENESESESPNDHYDSTLETLDELNKIAVVIAIQLMVLIMLTGCICNVIAILAVKNIKKLKNMSNVFIINLSVCAILEMCIILPFNIYTYLQDGWTLDQTLCKFIACLGYALTGTTIATIILITYSRYQMILYPSTYRTVYTKSNVLAMVFTAWIIPLVCLIPAMFCGWGEFGYVPQLVSCNLLVEQDSRTFKLFLLILRVVLPCMVITYLYARIFRITYVSHRRLNNRLDSPCSVNEMKHYSKTVHLSKTITMILIVFIISYFPCTFIGIVDLKSVLSRNFNIFCVISSYFGSAVNPIVYVLMNRQFKQGYRKIFSCSGECCLTTELQAYSDKTICSFLKQSDQKHKTFNLVTSISCKTSKGSLSSV